jgi:hypothetical protein
MVALLVLLVPVAALAMKMDDSSKAMDHGSMKMDDSSKTMDHGSMGMQGVVMLQDEVVNGVKASAHLMDMEGGMGQMLMVMFTDEKSGEMIMKGQVAVKVQTPDEKTGEAQAMKKSKGMFGAGVKFEQKGTYQFMVGTKLADDEKRTFNFHYDNK